MSDDRDRAVALLVNYFKALARKSGFRWEADYTVEIGEAVDAIIDPLTTRLIALERTVARIEAQFPSVGEKGGGR